MWGNVWFDFKNRFFNRTGRTNLNNLNNFIHNLNNYNNYGPNYAYYGD